MLLDRVQFSLQGLLGSLPPSRRRLVLEVRDPASLSTRVPITGARSLELARETELVFCKAESAELASALLASRSRFIVARPELLPMLPAGFAERRALVLSARPRLLLASLLAPFDVPAAVAKQRQPIHPHARVSSSAVIGLGAVVGADVEIGAGCVVGPNTVLDHVTVGDDSRIGFNCSIGTDGFAYEIDEETGEIVKLPHFGRILIGKGVEIGCNTCINRGSLSDTVLEDDVKVDGLVHIGHNCRIKRGAFVIANAMVAGSATIGEYGWVAPSASVINGVGMGRCAMAGVGAVVAETVGDNEVVVGVPARKLRDRFAEDSPLLRG